MNTITQRQKIYFTIEAHAHQIDFFKSFVVSGKKAETEARAKKALALKAQALGLKGQYTKKSFLKLRKIETDVTALSKKAHNDNIILFKKVVNVLSSVISATIILQRSTLGNNYTDKESLVKLSIRIIEFEKKVQTGDQILKNEKEKVEIIRSLVEIRGSLIAGLSAVTMSPVLYQYPDSNIFGISTHCLRQLMKL